MKEKSGIAPWLVLGILGILLILGQRAFKNLLYALVGIGLMPPRAAGIWHWWQSRSRSSEAISSLLGSIVFFLVGLWIVTHPTTFDRILNVAIGLVLIICGAMWFSRGLHLGRSPVVLALAGGEVLLGLIIALNSPLLNWVIIAEGFGLIYTAVGGILTERLTGAAE